MPKLVNPTMLKVALLSIGLQDIAAGASTPALASIIAAYPNFAPPTVMMIQTLPPMVAGLVSLLYGVLTKFFRKRTLLFFGLACFLVGGVLPAFLDSLYAIIFCRGIVGIGAGICFPMSMNIIADFYDGDQRASMLGYSSGIGCGGGIIFQMLGGYLASFNWHYCFFAYLLILIIIVITFFWLPEPEKRQVAVDAPKEKIQIPARVIGLCGLGFLWTILNFVLITNTAIFIQNSGYGSPAATGTVLALFTAGGFLGGIFFGRVKKAIGNYVVSLFFFISAAAFAIGYFSTGLPMLLLAGLVAGLSLGLYLPALSARITEIINPTSYSWAISLLVLFLSVAQFVQAMILAPILSIFHLEYGRSPFAISTTGFLIIAVLLLIYTFFASKAHPTKIANTRMDF